MPVTALASFVWLLFGIQEPGSILPEPVESLVAIATLESAESLNHRLGEGALLPADLHPHLRPLLRTPPGDPALADRLGLTRMFVLEGIEHAELQTTASRLRDSGLFEAVATDSVGWADSQADEKGSQHLPPDEHFREQYALHNTGQTIDGQRGRPGADINAQAAWGLSHGSAQLVVAVFDAGISESHPDLAPKLVPGWNFVTDSPNTDDPYTSHGTHCAGIIAALTGTREGIAGIGWRCQLMPVVVLNKYGFGNETTLAEALVWTADQGVTVASVSMGFNPTDGDADDIMLRAAVEYATQRGMLICASSGNVASNRIGAPARYPQTIAVGATDNLDQPWASTSTGPELCVTAPGVSIISTWDSLYQGAGEDTYDYKTGTSQACPHVAGVAALVRSINSRLSPAQTAAIIQQTSRDLGEPGWDPHYGFGRLDAGAAAREAKRTRGRFEGQGHRCIADFDSNGTVNTRDFIVFLRQFHQHSRLTDLAEPYGEWNTLDLLAFLEAWADGCPEGSTKRQ